MKLKEILHLFGKLEHFRLSILSEKDRTMQRFTDITLHSLCKWGEYSVRYIMAYETGYIALFLEE